MIQRAPYKPLADRAGFTIVEIVVAFIIIGILAAVLVPSLTSRSNDARISAAQQDLKGLADAEERAAVDTGYLYRIDVLNDSRGGDGRPTALEMWSPNYPDWPPAIDQRDTKDGIRDNGVSTNNLYKTPTQIFIEAKSSSGQGQNFLSNYDDLFIRLTGSSNGSLSGNQRAETEFNWCGPYINWTKDVNHNDWPDDPWGNDYLFFTAKGVIWAPVRLILDPYQNGDGSRIFNVKGPKCAAKDATGAVSQHEFPASNIFDRPTVLSLGPNGLPGSGTTTTTDPGYGYGHGDDIVVQFGGN